MNQSTGNPDRTATYFIYVPTDEAQGFTGPFKGLWIQCPRATHSDDFGVNQVSFAEHCDRTSAAEMQSFYSHQVAHGVPYTESLYRDGGSYCFYCFPGMTDEQISNAKAYIEERFDVVSKHIFEVVEMVTDWEPIPPFTRAEPPSFITVDETVSTPEEPHHA